MLFIGNVAKRAMMYIVVWNKVFKRGYFYSTIINTVGACTCTWMNSNRLPDSKRRVIVLELCRNACLHSVCENMREKNASRQYHRTRTSCQVLFQANSSRFRKTRSHAPSFVLHFPIRRRDLILLALRELSMIFPSAHSHDHLKVGKGGR